MSIRKLNKNTFNFQNFNKEFLSNYKYGSGNSNVTSLPVNFLYTEAKVST